MDVCFLARAASSGECLRGEGLVWLIGAVVCVIAAAFALPHHWLLPINCHFLRLYSAAGRGIAAVSSAIEESDLYLFFTFWQWQLRSATLALATFSTNVPLFESPIVIVAVSKLGYIRVLSQSVRM